MPGRAALPKTSELPEMRHGGGLPPGGDRPAVSNGRVAIAMLIVAETMLFTTLIGGYLVLRGAGSLWPPPGQPRLPLVVTWLNTALLAASCATMARGWTGLRDRDPSRLRLSILETAVLGSAFLVIQGSEWIRLISYGLTLSSGVYGATFYLLIGLHGLHVLAAVAWLGVIALRFRGDRFTLKKASGIDLCAIYWFYVCALWGVLFPLVYLV